MEDKSMKLDIRQEEANDFPSIYNIHSEAFGRKDEARLADRLRLSGAYIPELSLVAVVNGKVVGHIMFSKITIVDNDKEVESLALAPMSVTSSMQNKGIGGSLIHYGLNRARELGYRSVIVLGHIQYYPKFGFVPTDRWQIKAPFNVPANAFMGLELVENGLSEVKGTVRFSQEFQQI